MTVSQRSSLALSSLLQIKTGKGTLYRLICYNDSASAQYIQLHNEAAVPVGVSPLIQFTLAAKAIQSLSFEQIGIEFNAGIFVGNSSTAGTYTAGSADCWFFAQYV